MSVNPCRQLVEIYVRTCCETLSASDFEEIISEDVKLCNQTNDEAPVNAEGKKIVQELFEKYIFNNTSQITNKHHKIENIPGGLKLHLSVEETKNNEGKINRCLFQETTIFQFNGANKICSIDMRIKRTLIQQLGS